MTETGWQSRISARLWGLFDRRFGFGSADPVDWYRGARRFEQAKRAGLAVITAFSVSVAAWLPGLRILKAVSRAVEAHPNLANVALSAVLAAITGVYAFLTHALLRETRTARLQGVRPTIRIRIATLELNDVLGASTSGSAMKSLGSTAVVDNIGRGAAIDLRLEVVVPWMISKNSRTEYVMKSVAEHTTVPVDARVALPFEILTCAYDLPHRHNSFVELTAYFEDSEVELFEIKQFYDLTSVSETPGQSPILRLRLNFEDLRRVRTRRRMPRSGMDIRSSVDREKIDVLLERG